MRTSRISQETSRIISATTSQTTKRSTRSSLSRFRHRDNTEINGDSAAEEDSSALDIEDSIAPPSRKRKHESITTSTPASRISTPRKAAAVTVKTEVEDSVSFTPSPAKERRVRKPARQIKNEETGEVEIHPPNDWEEVYNVVKEMRKHGAAAGAAVDTMGCERLAEEVATPRNSRFQTLVALMLSSQTKDTTTAVVMAKLQKELPPYQPGAPKGLNLENIIAVEPALLNEMIWAVGFHNNKTRYIKAAAEICRDQHGGDIPDTVEGLMALPGVGPKMAYLCMSTAWKRDEGIGVDVHVHRITNLWGWHKTKNPEETRIALQAWLPREKWHEINWLLVGLGQKVCLPVGRKCGECELGLRGLCKSAERGKVILGRKIKEERIKEDENGDVVGIEETIKTEEEVFADGVVNAPADQGVDVEGPVQEDIPPEEGLSKKEEKEALEEIINAPGQLKRGSSKRRKR